MSDWGIDGKLPIGVFDTIAPRLDKIDFTLIELRVEKNATGEMRNLPLKGQGPYTLSTGNIHIAGHS